MTRDPVLPRDQADDAKNNGSPRGAIHEIFRAELPADAAGILRHWVPTASAPRLAPQEPFPAEPASPPETVLLHRAQKIFRTSGRKSAAAIRTGERGKRRRQRGLIRTNENADDRAHQGARIKARRARRNHSSSSMAKGACAARALPMTTIHVPAMIAC